MSTEIEIIKLTLQKVKDETLVFAVFTILVIVRFPQWRSWIFILFMIVIISYTFLKYAKIISKHRIQKSNNKFLDNFSNFLKNPEQWEKRQINNSEIYFYKEDNNYRIEQAEEPTKDWSARESWMEVFPDQSITEYCVHLKYNESRIAEFTFLSCDGSRYFIPIPEKRCLKKGDSWKCLEWGYFWKRDSVEFNLGAIIGSFYHYSSLDEVADFCHITIE